MVWGGIMKDGKSELIHFHNSVTALVYMDQAINEGMMPMFNAFENTTLMHDNATPHSARATRQHLANLGFPVLPWPAKSPDLNPIEHVWDELERRLQQRNQMPTTLDELRVAITEEWHAIPRDRIRKVITSMRRRCQAVMAADGGHTIY